MKGAPTNYTLDLAARLTQVLADGSSTYLYGLGRIGEQQPGGWMYHLGDALGSVRQLAGASAGITLARSYKPFGDPLMSIGAGSSIYGFTGEQRDRTGLVYLRARYLSPSLGRFLSRDALVGQVELPLTLNRWNYALSAPTTYTDPTGQYVSPTGPQTCLAFVFSYGLLPGPNVSAQRLVDICRGFYSQAFWRSPSPFGAPSIDCARLHRVPWTKPQSPWGLFADFICERGDNPVRFDARDALTHQMAHSFALDTVRREFYQEGPPYDREVRFGPGQYLAEWVGLVADQRFPLLQIIGSFDVWITTAGSGRIRLRVDNWMDLASGTHFIGRFPPEGQAREPLSLEEVIDRAPILRGQPAWWVVATYQDDHRGKIVSVLRVLTREQTPPGMGGGATRQIFEWTERDLGCQIGQKPGRWYLHMLDIGS